MLGQAGVQPRHGLPIDPAGLLKGASDPFEQVRVGCDGRQRQRGNRNTQNLGGRTVPNRLPIAEQLGLVGAEHPAVQNSVGVFGLVPARLPVLDPANQGLPFGKALTSASVGSLGELLGHVPLRPQPLPSFGA